MQCDSAAALAWLAAPEGDDAGARRSTAALLLDALGAQRGPPLRGLGPALGGRLARAHGALARRARLRRGAVGDRRRRPATPTRWRRSPTRSARPRWPRATPTPRPSSSPAPSSSTRTSSIPFERAQILLRAGVALAAAGEREPRVDQLAEAHRVADALGARPLAARGGRRVAALGEPRSSEHLGRRAAAEHESARALAPRARGRAPGRRGPHEPRDRRATRPQHAHRRHARAQHPRQAALPHPHRGRAGAPPSSACCRHGTPAPGPGGDDRTPPVAPVRPGPGRAGSTEARSPSSAGRKTGHWMWFVFPQVAGPRAQRDGEALCDRLGRGGQRLSRPSFARRAASRCARAMLASRGQGADQMLGDIDAMKLRSSMTLFARAAPDEPVFREVLDRYFEGSADEATEQRL